MKLKQSVVHIGKQGTGGSVGYRSEVAFKCSEEAHKVLLSAAELNKDLQDLLKASDRESCSSYNNDEEGFYYWEYVKWYESYSDVSAFERIMDLLDEMALDGEYGFIRLGEDFDDHELRGDPGEFGMYINRSIEL
jgi:hypothetical protein